MPEDATKEYEQEARRLRWKGRANVARGTLTGDEDLAAEGRSQETLASLRDYAGKVSETTRRSEAMADDDEDERHDAK